VFEHNIGFVPEARALDCIIEGEVETVVGKIFKAALNGESLPSDYGMSVNETLTMDDIPRAR